MNFLGTWMPWRGCRGLKIYVLLRFLDNFGGSGTSLPAPPGKLLGVSWQPPGSLLGASWKSPGSFLGASWESPGRLWVIEGPVWLSGKSPGSLLRVSWEPPVNFLGAWMPWGGLPGPENHAPLHDAPSLRAAGTLCGRQSFPGLRAEPSCGRCVVQATLLLLLPALYVSSPRAADAWCASVQSPGKFINAG